MSDLSNATGTWTIDAVHSTVGFTVRHAMISKVRGNFTEFAGQINFDGANPAASSATLTIQAASINTKNADRDGHLTSADFLDVANAPTLEFVSTGVAVKGDNKFDVTGDLTIHGVTKSVTIDFELGGVSQNPWGQTLIGFEGHTEISREEFGLTWNAALETGGVLVGDKVKIELEIEAIKA